ncbi:DUF2997 domain-containing protein [Ornatilinea apprima]
MNKPHKIEIQITPEGKVIGEVKGVSGPQCGPLTKWLEEIGSVQVDRSTPDYHKNSDQNLTVKR